MAVLGITAVSAGAVEYLLRGSGCAEHEHAPSPAEAGVAPEGGAAGSGKAPGANYLLSSSEREAPGVWFGGAVEEMLGIAPGTPATAEDVRAVFGKLTRPGSTPDDPQFLGRPPRNFKSTAERIAAAVAAEADAGEERLREIENTVRASGRKAVAYYDLTFSPVKSVSVLHAALRSEGREEQAQEVVEAHRAAIAVAMEFVEKEAAWTRTGYHGRTAGGHSVGVFEEATGLVWTRWDHSTNRNQEPQLHTHVAVLNRVIARSTRRIQALDGKGFRPIKFGAAALYQQALEQELGRRLGVVFAQRPDGKAREIMGIDQRLCAEASSRARQVESNLTSALDSFRETYGREPSPRERKEMWADAKLLDRAHKTGDVAPATQLDNWAQPRRADLAAALDAVVAQAEQVGRYGHPDQRGYAHRSRAEVLQAAVQRAQTTHATWTLGNLIDAVQTEQSLTPAVVGDPAMLAADVVNNAAAYGLVAVGVPDPGPVPTEIARTDGKSPYRRHHDDRWATFEQLATETAIVGAARRVGAPSLTGPALELARVELIAAGLGPDQLDAAAGILSSGRAGDVLVGAAGAGKSRTVGALARVWESQLGGRVIGVATSEIATRVLGADGLEAYNSTQFLRRFGPDDRGLVADVLRAGDLVVVDEAGMSSTSDLAALSQLVAAAGGKLLFTGDHRQLSAVGAGGVFEQLVRDNGAFELAEIHRFTEAWERGASTRLRERDTAVLGLYEDSGRLVGGTLEATTAAAVRAYVADTVAGKQSLLVVRENALAGELSALIRGELVALGRVDPEVLATLRDGNLVGVGDLIQARRNDYDQRVDGPGAVTNRAVYRVLGRGRDGTLHVVEGDEGAHIHLSPDYVREHVELAYAGTVYAAQGRTVDTSYLLVDERANAELVYVGLTRGRELNVAFVVSERTADAHHPVSLDSTPRAVLAGVLDHDDEIEAVSAELARRANEEEGRSLAFVGTQLDLLAAAYGKGRYERVLATELPEGLAGRIGREAGRDRLDRTLREAELAGHDVTAIVRAASEVGPLGTAESVSDVLRWRIRERVLIGRRGEHDPADVLASAAPGSWADLASRVQGATGEYAQLLADACGRRQHELGERAAFEQPQWALAHLGEAPTDLHAREQWIDRAGIAAAYRELRNIPESSIALGAAPPREQVLHRALWHRAYAALGAPVEMVDYAAASETELRDWRAAAVRERSFAPYFVADELRDTRLAARDYHQDVALFAAAAEQLPVGSPERARADEDLVAAEQLAAELDARAEHLDVVHAAREAWAAAAVFAEQRAQLSGDELVRRGLDRDPQPPAGEQTALFAIADPDTKVDPERGRDTQLELDLDDGRLQVLVPEVQPEPAASEPAATVDAVEVDPDQFTLFPTRPAAADIAAARPLREHGVDDDEPITVGQARRQAEILAELRTGRPADPAETLERWQQERTATATEHEVDRDRRDQGLDAQQDLQAGRDVSPARTAGAAVEAEPELGLDWD
ncbi:MAG: MobF family relaxase [Gemmatimonadales bacterium]